MACTDPRYQQLLADAVLGKLSDGEMFQVQSHLQGCPDCRETARAVALLAGKDYDELSQEFGAHLSDETLTRYYSDRSSLEGSRLRAVEIHLEKCQLCRGELQLLEQAGDELLSAVTASQDKSDDNQSSRRRFREIIFHPVFAAAVLIIIAAPFFMMWNAHHRETDPGKQPTAPAIILREATRSSGDMQVVQKHATDNYLHLQIPYPYQLGARYYSVSLKEAGPAHSISTPVWLRFSQAGRIDVLIEAGDLADGAYELELLDIGRDVAGDTMSSSFGFKLENLR